MVAAAAAAVAHQVLLALGLQLSARGHHQGLRQSACAANLGMMGGTATLGCRTIPRLPPPPPCPAACVTDPAYATALAAAVAVAVAPAAIATAQIAAALAAVTAQIIAALAAGLGDQRLKWARKQRQRLAQHRQVHRAAT